MSWYDTENSRYNFSPYDDYEQPDWGMQNSGQGRSSSPYGSALSGGAAGAAGGPWGIALGAAGGLLSGLSNPGGRERKRAYKDIKSQIGKPVYDVGRIVTRGQQFLRPLAAQYGRAADQRFGFDSGRGQGYILDNLFDDEARRVYETDIMNQRETSDRDRMYRMALLNYQG